jgi:AcrR family transcriptional regulator
MDEPSIAPRSYDSPARREQAARTRERIVTAGSELVHQYQTWDWRELTFRAVAARAGVGERTVYRHFPTERDLHDAVMRRLEDEAGIAYEEVDLGNLTHVTARVFAALQRFTVDQSGPTAPDATFAGADQRRRDALLRAVTDAAPTWPPQRVRAAAGLLDVLWNLPSYERLISAWQLPPEQATGALTWLIGHVIATIETPEPTAAETADPPVPFDR